MEAVAEKDSVVASQLSLIAISALDFDTLLAGYGAPVIGRASQKVKDMVAHLNLCF
jgi:hypothetical protein